MYTVLVRQPSTASLPHGYLLDRIVSALIDGAARARSSVSDDLRAVAETYMGGGSAGVAQIVRALDVARQAAPIAILVDDYHRAAGDDAQSPRRARVVDIPILLAVAIREEPGEEKLSEPPQPHVDLWIERIEVGGLSREGVGMVAQDVLDGPPLHSLTVQLHDQTLGNPLFVLETLRIWRDGGHVIKVAQRWSLDGAELSTMLSSIARAMY